MVTPMRRLPSEDIYGVTMSSDAVRGTAGERKFILGSCDMSVVKHIENSMLLMSSAKCNFFDTKK